MVAPTYKSPYFPEDGAGAYATATTSAMCGIIGGMEVVWNGKAYEISIVSQSAIDQGEREYQAAVWYENLGRIFQGKKLITC